MKVLIAGVVGGLLVFCWSAVSHMALPLGEMGIEQSGGPNEAAILESLKADLPASGLYMLPTADPSITDPKLQMEDAMQKWSAGPSAVINYRAEGMSAMGTQTLGKEAAANVLAALIAAIVLAASKCSHGSTSRCPTGSGTASPATTCWPRAPTMPRAG
jgi:hypothetical protein